MTPQTLEGIRELVASLPPWCEDMDDDPLWMRPLSDFGIHKPLCFPGLARRIPYRREKELLNLDDSKWIWFDPNLITETGQAQLRLDALLHYMESDELFDQESWYGTHYPVIVLWGGDHIVFDGNHRIIADKLMGRKSKVLLTEL